MVQTVGPAINEVPESAIAEHPALQNPATKLSMSRKNIQCIVNS